MPSYQTKNGPLEDTMSGNTHNTGAGACSSCTSLSSQAAAQAAQKNGSSNGMSGTKVCNNASCTGYCGGSCSSACNGCSGVANSTSSTPGCGASNCGGQCRSNCGSGCSDGCSSCHTGCTGGCIAYSSCNGSNCTGCGGQCKQSADGTSSTGCTDCKTECATMCGTQCQGKTAGACFGCGGSCDNQAGNTAEVIAECATNETPSVPEEPKTIEGVTVTPSAGTTMSSGPDVKKYVYQNYDKEGPKNPLDMSAILGLPGGDAIAGMYSNGTLNAAAVASINNQIFSQTSPGMQSQVATQIAQGLKEMAKYKK